MTPLTPWLLLIGSILTVHSVTALHGRFLTLSDLHADWNYVDASSLSKACHRGKHPKRKDTAGYWGSPVSDCDSPASLIDSLMHELECKWKDKVDFVILMGDFARSASVLLP